MSRRKQANPKALKHESDNATENTVEQENTLDIVPRDFCPVPVSPKVAPPDVAGDGAIAPMRGVDEDVYYCQMCNKSFPSLTLFMEHRNNDTCLGIRSTSLVENDSYLQAGSLDESERSSLSPNLTDTSDSPGPVQSPGDQLSFECHICNHVFKHKRSRDRHLRLHTGDRKYKCSHCDMAFARSDHLKLHLKSHSGNLTKSHHDTTETDGKTTAQLMQCLLCSKSFTSLKDAQTHFSQHCHGGDATSENNPSSSDSDFKEENLDKLSFSTSMLTGKSILNYQCSFCSEVLQGPVWLAKHLIDHHVQADGRAPCSFCNLVTFESVQEMYSHLVGHDWEGNGTKGEKRKSESVANGIVKKAKKKNQYTELPQNETGVDYSCPHCAKQSLRHSFETIELLEIHINTFHAGKSVQMYSCPKCDAIFPTVPILNDHIDKVHEQGGQADSFQCRHCPAIFSNHRSLAKHKNVVHKDAEVSKISDFLAASKNRSTQQSKFSGALSLKIPQLSKFSKSLKNKSGEASILESPTFSQRDMISPGNSFINSGSWSPRTCDHCNALFKEPYSYEVHMKIHTKTEAQEIYSCPKCGAVFTTEDDLENHLMTHFLSLSTEYGCVECMKLFNKPDELQKHLMDIHAHHLYKCSLCSEIFDSKVNIQVHFAVKHSNECKIHKCSVCNLLFHSEMEWRLHVKVSHLKVGKPYRCLLCKESFVSDDQLQTHMASHSKQFKCLMCEEAFHVEFLLDKHVQMVHSRDGNGISSMIKMAVDEVMDLSRKSKSPTSHVLENCSKTPSPKSSTPKKTYLCAICDAAFADSSEVQAHRMEAHYSKSTVNGSPNPCPSPSGQMMPMSISSQQYSRHLCLYCRQSFKSKSELERHVRIHITANNLKCNICDESFPTTTILAEHKLQHCKVPKGNICVVCKTALKNEEHYHIHSNKHGIHGSCDPCIVCCQTLASKTELQMHAKYHFQAFYSCCVCQKNFDSKESLISKYNSIGGAYYFCRSCYGSEDSGSEEYNCTFCQKSFRSKQQFDVHLSTVQHSLKVNSVMQKMSTSNNYTCCVCARRFSNKQNLMTQISATNQEFYTCKGCYMAVDMNKNHTPNGNGTKPRCPKCSVKFESNLDLASHICIQKKEFPCCLCKAAFLTDKDMITKVNSQGLTYHMCKSCIRVESKPPSPLHKCPKCNLVFPAAELLSQHIPTHDQNIFQCIKCQKSFATKEEIAAHVTTHVLQEGNTHECKLCGDKLDSPAKLQLHLIEHSYEDSPMTCCICNIKFESASEIQQHVLTHPANTRPYACTECNHSFYFSAELQNHAFMHESAAKKKLDSMDCTVKEENDSHDNSLDDISSHNNSLDVIPSHDNSLHVCPHCLEMFESLSLMDDHISSVHSDIVVKKET